MLSIIRYTHRTSNVQLQTIQSKGNCLLSGTGFNDRAERRSLPAHNTMTHNVFYCEGLGPSTAGADQDRLVHIKETVYDLIL